MADRFTLVDPNNRDPSRRLAFETQRVPEELGNHDLAAQHYQPDEKLVLAVNAALAVGAPLLITGEPGTGKTQVAYWIAHYFDITDRLFRLMVRSSTTAEDLLYEFNTVAYFHATHDPNWKDKSIDRSNFIRKGPLWSAFETSRSIVLIDEIDKAPRDFPNDLLHALDQHEFYIRELDQWKKKPKGVSPPFVVITSNSERRLPEPFLRRCIFHHIDFDEQLVRNVVMARSKAGDFGQLKQGTVEEGIKRFLEIRKKSLQKKPATGELLVWLTILSALGTTEDELRKPLRSLPAITALVKNKDDLANL